MAVLEPTPEYRLREPILVDATTLYHPQCNGMVERVHRAFKPATIAPKQSWLDVLPVVLMGMCATPN